MTILRPVSRLALLFGARSNRSEPTDSQPGPLIPHVGAITPEQAERAAVRLGMVFPSDGQDQDAFPQPDPRQPLPTTQAPREPLPVPLSDPLLIAARQAGHAYDATAVEWTFEGYNAAIIAAVLPVHDRIRDSEIENR